MKLHVPKPDNPTEKYAAFLWMPGVCVSMLSVRNEHNRTHCLRKYQGTVRSVLDFGAFVDIGAEGDGLLHISQISQERIDNIYDVLSEGQQALGLRNVEGAVGCSRVQSGAVMCSIRIDAFGEILGNAKDF